MKTMIWLGLAVLVAGCDDPLGVQRYQRTVELDYLGCIRQTAASKAVSISDSADVVARSAVSQCQGLNPYPQSMIAREQAMDFAVSEVLNARTAAKSDPTPGSAIPAKKAAPVKGPKIVKSAPAT